MKDSSMVIKPFFSRRKSSAESHDFRNGYSNYRWRDKDSFLVGLEK
jgi:hypothetical protein